jgi:hypothetical protein
MTRGAMIRPAVPGSPSGRTGNDRMSIARISNDRIDTGRMSNDRQT